MRWPSGGSFATSPGDPLDDGAEPTEDQVAALTEYLLSLELPPSLAEARGELKVESIAKGETVFRAQGCVSCHAPPAFTTPGVYDVAIHDAVGNKEFNPPSLRGVSHRSKLFHDNRAGDLRELFLTHQHGLDAPLEKQDLTSLVLFLRSL